MTEQAQTGHAHYVDESTFRALSSCQIGAMRWRENLGATALNSVAQSLLALPSAATPIPEEAFFARIYDEDRDRVRRSFDLYLQSRSLQTKEIHMRVVAAETGAVQKLNCVLSSIATEDGLQNDMVVIFRDFTEPDKARTEILLKSELERLIIAISIKLIDAPIEHLDSVITEALGDTSRYVGADRAYLFTYDWENETCCNTHEWCAEGIDPQIDSLQETSVSDLELWTTSHKKRLPFIASAVMTLSPDHPLRQILEPQGIKSLVTIPVCTGGECVGFIGFDSVRSTHHYTDVEVSLLSLLAELVANAQTKRDREQKLLDTLLSLEESRNSALTMAAIAGSANEAKSRFVATMSHEIRTPLHVILGTTELLRSSGLREDQIEYLEALEASGHNLLELIGDVLEVSRIESGNLVLNPVEFSLQAFVQGLQKVLQPLASRKGLALEFNIAPGSPDLLSHDASRLRQVVQNVAGNAIKFTERGKVTVDIALQKQASPSHQEDWSLAITITDTGIGMSPEEVRHLYEPFYQAAESRKNVIAGTGLGLAITHNLVELMSGSIVVNSAPGRGTAFTIRIPIQTAQGGDCATDSRADHEPIAPGTAEDIKALLDGARILVAEDNEISQRLIQAHLREFNCRLTFAGNGEEAVTAVAACDFDIILMDCQMPVLDGFGATESICAMLRQQSRRRPPIIAATANSVQGDRERCLAVGMDSMLSKPFSKSDLLSTLSNWLTSAIH